MEHIKKNRYIIISLALALLSVIFWVVFSSHFLGSEEGISTGLIIGILFGIFAIIIVGVLYFVFESEATVDIRKELVRNKSNLVTLTPYIFVILGALISYYDQKIIPYYPVSVILSLATFILLSAFKKDFRNRFVPAKTVIRIIYAGLITILLSLIYFSILMTFYGFDIRSMRNLF